MSWNFFFLDAKHIFHHTLGSKVFFSRHSVPIFDCFRHSLHAKLKAVPIDLNIQPSLLSNISRYVRVCLSGFSNDRDKDKGTRQCSVSVSGSCLGERLVGNSKHNFG